VARRTELTRTIRIGSSALRPFREQRLDLFDDFGALGLRARGEAECAFNFFDGQRIYRGPAIIPAERVRLNGECCSTGALFSRIAGAGASSSSGGQVTAVELPTTLARRGAPVRLEGLSKVFADAVAVADLSLEVGAGEFLTLLGPSGSGKSTTLLMIAGFLVPTRGEIFIDGVPVARKPPHERDIGVVFQSYALFPHLTVYENVAFPLRMRNLPASRIVERVDYALDLMRLEGLGLRYPHQLSGGQQQRVALARAIVFEPPLLLMDEPLGALDRKLREAMQLELKRLQRTLALTVIYVTHDQEEALTMSDRIAVMNRGRIEQVASPEELYEHPRTPFVADFLGESNSLCGKVVRAESSRLVVRTSAGMEVVTGEGVELAAGREVRLAIRPEQVGFLGSEERSDNVAEGVVEEVVYLGEAVRYLVRLTPGELLCVKRQNQRGSVNPQVGQPVRLGWSADAVILHTVER